MTNFEYYKDKILEIGCIDDVAVAKDGEIYKCSHFPDCVNCMFDASGDCRAPITKWLYEEHVEKPKAPKLTKKERLFCELVEKGYIARDDGDYLYVYKNKPHKNEFMWDGADEFYCDLSELEDLVTLKFDFIKWEDKEPWLVEELLKLPVED